MREDIHRRDFMLGGGALALGTATPLRAIAQTQASQDIVALDAVSLSRAIASRSVSCREVMAAYLAQIERLNPQVNAIVSLQDPQALLKQADERDAQLAVPPRPVERFQLSLSTAQLARLRLALLLVLPASAAILGLLVAWNRRR